MEKDYDLIRGQSKTWTLKFKENGSAVDITGYKVYLTIKSRIDMIDTEAEVSKDITITDPTLGIVTIELTKTETEDLAGKYYYDIKYLNSDSPSKSYTVYIGTMTFAKNVTVRTT